MQRLLVCKTPRDGLRAGVLSNLIGWPIAFVFLAIGLLLWVETQVHGTARVGADGDDRAVMIQFMLTELPLGIRGLMVAGLLAAAMSSLDSALNALAATTMNDLVQPWRERRGQAPLDDRTATRWSRGSMVGWAALLAGVAFALSIWQVRSGKTLLEFALGVMTYAYAGLLGVFLVAMFTRRGSGRSVVAALVDRRPGHSPHGSQRPVRTRHRLVPLPGLATRVAADARGRAECRDRGDTGVLRKSPESIGRRPAAAMHLSSRRERS